MNFRYWARPLGYWNNYYKKIQSTNFVISTCFFKSGRKMGAEADVEEIETFYQQIEDILKITKYIYTNDIDEHWKVLKHCAECRALRKEKIRIYERCDMWY